MTGAGQADASGETVPVLCVDSFSDDAAQLKSDAARVAFVRDSPFYPGVRSAAPNGYADRLSERLTPHLAEAMGWVGDGLRVLASHYSLVTDPPVALSPLQRIPHIDSRDPDIVAVLHYLCGPEHGGTSLFRHRSTGFARISADRSAAYDAALDRDVARFGPPPEGYMEQRRGAFADVFERIETVDCRMGRVIAYPANALHCGRIPAGAVLSVSPTEGRLTLNTFFKRVPRGQAD